MELQENDEQQSNVIVIYSCRGHGAHTKLQIEHGGRSLTETHCLMNPHVLGPGGIFIFASSGHAPQVGFWATQLTPLGQVHICFHRRQHRPLQVELGATPVWNTCDKLLVATKSADQIGPAKVYGSQSGSLQFASFIWQRVRRACSSLASMLHTSACFL